MLNKLLAVMIISYVFMWAQTSDQHAIPVYEVNEMTRQQDQLDFADDILVYNNNQPHSHPVIARRGNEVYCAFECIYSGYACIFVRRSTDSGRHWQSFGGFYSSSHYDYYPAIAVTSNYVVVLYDVRTDPNVIDELWCAYSPRGSTASWSWALVDDPSNGLADVIAGTGDYVYAVYMYQYSGADRDVEFIKSSNGGQSWYGHVKIKGAYPDDNQYFRPKIWRNRSNGNLDAAWFEVDNGIPWYARSTNSGSSWSTDQLLGFNGGTYPDIATYSNSIAIVSRNSSGGALSIIHSTNSGSTWGESYWNNAISIAPEVIEASGYFLGACRRNSRIYYNYTSTSNPGGLSSGWSYITDGTTAMSDAIGICEDPAHGGYGIVVWKDSRSSTAIYCDGEWWEPGVEENNSVTDLHKTHSLSQNYPNPVTCCTEIHYTISQESNVKLQIYDASGRQIITLVDGNQQSGNYRISWNIQNTSKNQLPNGIYFYQLKTEYSIETKKMIVQR
jgi:hypothetical protein